MEEKITPGTIRAAITEFQSTKVDACWDAQGSAYRTRYPEFAMFEGKLRHSHLRITPNGQLVFEPAFVLDLLRKIEKQNEQLKEVADQVKELFHTIAKLPVEWEVEDDKR